MKKKNIKIKHRKYSLYQRKKSKGRKVLTVLLMIVLIAGLCVLGYGLGKPLVEYFSNRGTESAPESAWTPPVSTEPNSPSADGEEGSADTGGVHADSGFDSVPRFEKYSTSGFPRP